MSSRACAARGGPDDAAPMRWGWVVALGALALVAPGCRHPAPPPVVNGVQLGTASWYGPGFHGNRTANGEIYDQYELTAAHPSLPLGTHVMVTNLTNGRSVELRINDRGPFVDGRAIDLSYAAARVLGMIEPGTARVRIELLDAGTRLAAARPASALVPPPVRDLPRSRWTVEVAAFGSPSMADHLRGILARHFPDTHVSPLETGERSYFRVRLGPYALRGMAVARAEQVSHLGYPAVIAEEPPP
jgi:rare lipoprotein A